MAELIDSSYLNQVENGLNLQYGTYEQAKEWVGRLSPILFCPNEVNWAMIKFYCALVEDDNPCYWDEEYAESHFGKIVAPPGMLMTWSMPLPWSPAGEKGYPLFATQVPLPGDTVINVSTDTEFFHLIRVGDLLNVQDEVIDVSEEKHTKLGKGHFITTVSTYRDAKGRIMAKNTNVIFRYKVA